jgi:pyruvate dehydrogenase E2 component (dihydrolipoamide acetyltransferase)
MTQAVTMPALSDTMGAGRLVKWTKKVGDKISKGDIVAEVETDKAVMEVEAFEDGYLSGPLAAEGTEAPVGQTIGFIVDDKAEISGGAEAKAEAKGTTKSAEPPPSVSGDGHAASASVTQSPVSAVLAASIASLRSSPAASRPSTPPKGAPASHEAPVATPQAHDRSATANPVMAALHAGPPYRMEKLSSMREAMARNMIASLTTPTFRVTAQFPIKALKEAADKKHLSLTLLIARACALTVKAMPIFNAVYTPNGLARRDRVDVAIAVDLPDGLITLVLRDAAERPMALLVKDWQALREKVDKRRLKPEEYQGGTFYVSNLGMFASVHNFDAVLPVGAAAILCIGAGKDGRASFTVTCDHRVVSGADGARFLQTLEQYLKDPEKLFTEGTQQ